MKNGSFETSPGATPKALTVAPKLSDRINAINPAITKASIEAETSTPHKAAKKDRAYFSREMQNATFVFYRSAKVVADLLLDARLTLSPDEFLQFINEDCQFDSSLVYKFIKMAADFRLNDPLNQLLLPEAWTLRYEIMMMKESTFRIGVTKGIINPECKLDDLKSLRTQLEGESKRKTDRKAKTATVKAPTSGMSLVQEPHIVPEVSTAHKGNGAATHTEDIKPKTTDAVIARSEGNVASRVVEAKVNAPAPARSHLSIVISRELTARHGEDVRTLTEELKSLMEKYPFVGIVELKVAA